MTCRQKADESPVREVYLDAFRIARYPVTVDQYRLFVENDGYSETSYWDAGGFGQFGEPDGWNEQLQHPNWPVTGVSWYEAMAYCRWTGHRLPTEAQWERAARGTDGRWFPWGNQPADENRLNCADDDFKPRVGHATPVGVYPSGASPDGLYDMPGNVWEWCADWYGKYDPDESANPTGPKEAARRVVRGGGWLDLSRYCRCSYRDHDDPDDRGDFLGFRVLCLFGQDSC